MKPLRQSSFDKAQDRSVRAGYKQTDVGVIPEEWEVCPVGQKGEVVTGKALAVNGPGRQRP
jgi:type I restriction enzyme S subunit